MRVLGELCGIIVAGFLALFVGIAVIAGMILLWLCGIAGSLMLLVSLFAAMMYAVAGKHHDLTLTLVYLFYAGVPFVIIVAVTYIMANLRVPASSGWPPGPLSYHRSLTNRIASC